MEVCAIAHVVVNRHVVCVAVVNSFVVCVVLVNIYVVCIVPVSRYMVCVVLVIIFVQDVFVSKEFFRFGAVEKIYRSDPENSLSLLLG